MQTKRWLGWHFLLADGKCRYGDGCKPVKGRWLRIPDGISPVMCLTGFHASLRAIDALGYAPGPVVEWVELRGEIKTDTDKAVARERKCLAKADATSVLHEFACWCAEQALLADRKRGREPDKRSWAAVRTKRRWLAGKATDMDLAAAWDAAGAAAGAAEAAAWAAGDAAWDAQNCKLTAMLRNLLKLEGTKL